MLGVAPGGRARTETFSCAPASQLPGAEQGASWGGRDVQRMSSVPESVFLLVPL